MEAISLSVKEPSDSLCVNLIKLCPVVCSSLIRESTVSLVLYVLFPSFTSFSPRNGFVI